MRVRAPSRPRSAASPTVAAGAGRDWREIHRRAVRARQRAVVATAAASRAEFGARSSGARRRPEIVDQPAMIEYQHALLEATHQMKIVAGDDDRGSLRRQRSEQ